MYEVCVKMLAGPINPFDINRIESILFLLHCTNCDVIQLLIFDDVKVFVIDIHVQLFVTGVYPLGPVPLAIGGYEGVSKVYALGSGVKGLFPTIGSSLHLSSVF